MLFNWLPSPEIPAAVPWSFPFLYNWFPHGLAVPLPFLHQKKICICSFITFNLDASDRQLQKHLSILLVIESLLTFCNVLLHSHLFASQFPEVLSLNTENQCHTSIEFLQCLLLPIRPHLFISLALRGFGWPIPATIDWPIRSLWQLVTNVYYQGSVL